MSRDYFDPMFNGTETVWKHPCGLLYTDGVRCFAQDHAAYWTLDVVASYLPRLKKYEFLVVYFDVDENKCQFHVREDSDLPDVVIQEIPFTDLDVSVKFYLIDGMLMFPSDY